MTEVRERRSLRRRRSDDAAVRTGLHDGLGHLIIIGGNEAKMGDMRVLAEVAMHAQQGKLVVATVASSVPGENWDIYRDIFNGLGVSYVEHLEIPNRECAFAARHREMLEDANVVFFTGGDQGQLTTRIGGTPLHRSLLQLYDRGACIAGTSAGAAAMSETVITTGPGDEAHSEIGAFITIPGLGLLREVLIDQHFAQRGRMTRLIGAVSQNPHLMGIGIDEDTAIVVQGGVFSVVGAGSVYLVDAHEMTATNAGESHTRPMSVYDLRLHVLNASDEFDLRRRRPVHPGVPRN